MKETPKNITIIIIIIALYIRSKNKTNVKDYQN